MMRQLEAGGVPIFFDDDKPLEIDEHTINYSVMLRESHFAEKLAKGENEWLSQCKGKAVKLLSPAKAEFVPKRYRYKFIYMDRKVNSIAHSNQKFNERTKGIRHPLNAWTIEEFHFIRKESLKLVRSYDGSRHIVIKFEDMMKKPKVIALRVQDFLGVKLDTDAMAGIVQERTTRCYSGMMEEQIYTN